MFLSGSRKSDTYIDDALLVPHQEVPEEPRLVEITQPYHIIHTLHRGGVHGTDGALLLLVDLVPLNAHNEIIALTYNRSGPFGQHW